MKFEKITLEKKDNIALLSLDCASNLNALDNNMIVEICSALDICEDDNEVNAIVIKGNGKAFSSGGDIQAMLNMVKNNISIEDMITNAAKIPVKIKKSSKPVIAAVHGAVAGAGFNLALAADICISSSNAFFIQAFVKIGLIPDAGGLYLLSRAVGVSKAMDFALLGTIIKADEALRLGFVKDVFPLEELEENAIKLATSIASGPSVAYANMKKLMYVSQYADFEDYLKEEVARQIECSKTKDFEEGMTAFLEKRKPIYTDRTIKA